MQDSVTNFARAIEEFRKVWEGFPANKMLIFLEIARNDIARTGRNITEISEILDIPVQTLSRTIADMKTASTKNDGEVRGLVVSVADPNNFRARIPVLTDKGRALYARVLRTIGADEIAAELSGSDPQRR